MQLIPKTDIPQQIEKVFDVACTLTDVISCVPFESQTFEIGPSGYLQQFLNLIASLRGGRTKFLPLLIAKVSETLPSVITPTLQSPNDMHHPIATLQSPVGGVLSENLVDSLHSSTTNTPFDNTHINPMDSLDPLVTESMTSLPPGMMSAGPMPNSHYFDPLPPGQGTRFSSIPIPKLDAPIPRSMPGIQGALSDLQPTDYFG